jgi:hypothetical protein
MVKRKLAVDFCVAGGGMAGVCAALAAARAGVTVALVQDRSMLGGNASSEIRMHIVGASCSGKRPGARESGILDELRVEDAVRNPQRSAALFDLLLYDKVRQEPDITLLLDTAIVACRVEAGRIVSATALRNRTEETFEIEAAFFADCTGDGRLGVEAGAPYRMGREARAEYGETHAPEVADRRTLGSTILFQARRHDRPMPFVAPPWARRFTPEELRLRSHREYEYGYWWMEWGGELDTVADDARIRDELLAIALGVWDHVKNACGLACGGSSESDKWLDADPERDAAGPSHWALEWIGMLPGKRESRRFIGAEVLRERDVLEGRLPADCVAYGGWWIDFHPPGGVDAAREFPCEQVPAPHVYGIPLGCLYSRDVANLFFAGRNISATHAAFASTRVMGTCSVVGQAVGTAAAVAVARGFSAARELSGAIGEVQQKLLAADAWLPGVRNQDATDLARTATVRASSEAAGCPAAAVIDGVTRATSPELHPSLERAAHQWRSGAELPAWIELSWAAPRSIREVRIVFDTGFDRELTLSHSDLFNSRMIRGPQPETVRDYRIALDGRTVAVVKGNYHRLCIHRLDEPVAARTLRIEVDATHGDSSARIFEIRVG